MSVLTLALGRFRSVANLVTFKCFEGAKHPRGWENLQVVKSQNNVPSLQKMAKWQLFSLWTSTHNVIGSC